MGLFSNHAIVYARLKIGKKDYGVQPFVAQTRDLDTHQPLPGVEMGDIGPKFGYNSKDNGFMSFNNFPIPRTNLVSP
jgi:acyl-CoA oxidase